MKWALAACLTLAASSASAQAFRCSFQQPSGNPFVLTFAAVDEAKGTAQVLGNSGTSPAYVARGAEAISFVEMVPSGAVMTTTISTVGSSPRPALHSRNTVIAGEFVGSQMRGICDYLN